MTAERNAVQTDGRVRLLRLCHDNSRRTSHTACAAACTLSVIPRRERLRRGQAPPTRPVHGQDWQYDVQAEIPVQVPRAEQQQVKWRPAFRRRARTAVWSMFLVTRRQCVLAIVGRIGMPALCAWFPVMRCVAALEGDALVGAREFPDLPDGDISQRWRRCEERLRPVQPSFAPVQVERRGDFAVDPFERFRIADRSTRRNPRRTISSRSAWRQGRSSVARLGARAHSDRGNRAMTGCHSGWLVRRVPAPCPAAGGGRGPLAVMPMRHGQATAWQRNYGRR